MRNQNKSIFIFLQIAFQPYDMIGIQIVGRLIQKQDIRLFQKELCQKELGTLSAGKIAYPGVYIRDIDRHHNKAEYGIFIGEADARGRGVGTAAAKLMLRYCFEEEQLHRVYLRALSENGQAIRSYEKAGFRREGLLRDDVCIEGDYRDIVWMAAVNSGNDQENEE